MPYKLLPTCFSYYYSNKLSALICKILYIILIINALLSEYYLFGLEMTSSYYIRVDGNPDGNPVVNDRIPSIQNEDPEVSLRTLYRYADGQECQIYKLYI